MRKLLPILLALVGIGGGIGAGFVLRPAAQEQAALAENCIVAGDDAPTEMAPAAPRKDAPDDGGNNNKDYVKMNNQFVVPVVGDSRIAALVVMSVSLEVSSGTSNVVYQREPKLRDSFLQVLFDHANIGGFEGAFTESNKLDPLRRNMLSEAKAVLGNIVTDVLITEIARQDS